MTKEKYIECARRPVPPGAYTTDTLPPLSEGAKQLETSTMRLAEKLYAIQQQAVAGNSKDTLRISDRPRTWLHLTDTPKRC